MLVLFQLPLVCRFLLVQLPLVRRFLLFHLPRVVRLLLFVLGLLLLELLRIGLLFGLLAGVERDITLGNLPVQVCGCGFFNNRRRLGAVGRIRRGDARRESGNGNPLDEFLIGVIPCLLSDPNPGRRALPTR